MKRLKKYLAGIAFSLIAVGAVAAYTQPLGGSIFPLTFVKVPVTNLTDAYNEMLALINAQVVGISPTYANAMAEPSGGVDTSTTTFSTSIQGNPLGLVNHADILVSTSLTSASMTTIIASGAGRTLYPGGGLDIMVSGTGATATGLALECSDGTLIASWALTVLTTNTPLSPWFTSAAGDAAPGPGLNGCPASKAIMLSNVGTNITTTTHVYVNLPYTVQ